MELHEIEEAFRLHDSTFKRFLPAQLKALHEWEGLRAALVHYPTGTGKTKTMLAMMAARGETEIVVVTPPITQPKWIREGKMLGITVIAMSHAKFRMKDVKLHRHRSVIVDEFHLLGGHTGAGWTKFDRFARGSTGNIIIGSATPNYNDAERCYCIQHVINPEEAKGGFLAFIYKHCKTEQNPFGAIPKVTGFLHYDSAAEFLADQPGVIYLPDEAPDILVNFGDEDPDALSEEFLDYNLDRSRNRIMASMMEIRSRSSLYTLIEPTTEKINDWTAEHLGRLLGDALDGQKPVILFAQRSTVARALADLHDEAATGETDPEMIWFFSYGYLDGSLSSKKKDQVFQDFLDGKFRILIGTATMATGADGIDKMCDSLVIVDDTDDASLRRQLIGRILPRGIVKPEDYDNKVAYRLYGKD